MERSPSLTEIAIVRQALSDVMGRLEGVAQTPFVQQLSARAASFLQLVARWEEGDPSDSERSSVVRRVLDLQIDLMKAGYESADS